MYMSEQMPNTHYVIYVGRINDETLFFLNTVYIFFVISTRTKIYYVEKPMHKPYPMSPELVVYTWTIPNWRCMALVLPQKANFR